MGRGDQLSRQWRLLRLIEGRPGRTLPELAAALEVHARTARRDLDALQKAGFPLYNNRREGKVGWHLVEGYRTDLPVPLSLTELLSLRFTEALVGPLHGTPLAEGLASAYAKLRALLPEQADRVFGYLSTLVGTHAPGSKDYRRFGAILQRVNQALQERRTLALLYHSFARRKTIRRAVDPYRIIYHQGGLYLIGFDHLRGEVRLFAVERIREAAILGRPFAVPAGFDPAAYLRDAFGIIRGTPVPVRLRVAPAQARYVRERPWHPSQKLRPTGDGGLLMSLAVPITPEVTRWILGFGGGVEVLEPAALRQAIATAATELAARHGRRKIAASPVAVRGGGQRTTRRGRVKAG